MEEKAASRPVRKDKSPAAAVPPVTPIEPLPPSYEALREEHNALKEHAASLEQQLQFVKDGRRKQQEQMRQQLSAAEKQNSKLKKQLAEVEREKEGYYLKYLDKEKSLQAALVHLSTAQVVQSVSQLVNQSVIHKTRGRSVHPALS